MGAKPTTPTSVLCYGIPMGNRDEQLTNTDVSRKVVKSSTMKNINIHLYSNWKEAILLISCNP